MLLPNDPVGDRGVTRARVPTRGAARRRPRSGIYVHAKVQMFDDDLLVCGSTNLNRRSFVCDTEISFAVADAEVLDDHQRALWDHLFPGTKFPLDRGPRPMDWGARMFRAIAEASGVTRSNRASTAPKLIRDPWKEVAAELPNHAVRKRSGPGFLYDITYACGLDATSVAIAVESGTPTLADISHRLENVYTVSNNVADFTYRKPG